ncbi:MAG: hypothetical protein V7K42_18060 [Nostoc sp.]
MIIWIEAIAPVSSGRILTGSHSRLSKRIRLNVCQGTWYAVRLGNAGRSSTIKNKKAVTYQSHGSIDSQTDYSTTALATDSFIQSGT